MANFFGGLHDHSPSLDSKDILVWVGTKNNVFLVKSFYSSLDNKGADTFPHGIVWNMWAPVRVSFFVWEVTWAKILTQDQLRRRGWKMNKIDATCAKNKKKQVIIFFYIAQKLVFCGN